jgi:hypothetical protein
LTALLPGLANLPTGHLLTTLLTGHHATPHARAHLPALHVHHVRLLLLLLLPLLLLAGHTTRALAAHLLRWTLLLLAGHHAAHHSARIYLAGTVRVGHTLLYCFFLYLRKKKDLIRITNKMVII